MQRPRRVSKFGMLLACAFIAFGVVNLVHPLPLHLFQATCARPMFFSCGIPAQELDEFGVFAWGLISIAMGLFVGWLSWQRTAPPRRLRKQARPASQSKPR